MKKDLKRTNDLRAQADKAGYREEFDSRVVRQNPQRRFFQAAGIAEDDPRWLKLKEHLAENAPTSLYTPALDRLYSQMQEVPKQHIVAHGGVPGQENPVTAREKELLYYAADELLKEFAFSGASLPKDSSLGMVMATNDPLIRAKVITDSLTYTKDAHPVLRFEGDNVSKFHDDLVASGLMYPWTMSISRRQADRAGKIRREWVVDGRLVEIDNMSRLGPPWQTCRFRRPQAPDGRLSGGHSVLIQGFWKQTVARYSSMLKMTSPADNAGFIQKAIDEIAAKRPGSKFSLVGFDGVGWEKFLSTWAFRAFHETYDERVGNFGWTRNLVNARVMDASREGDALWFSGPEAYSYNDDLGYGTRSGLFSVAQLNQVGACAVALYIIEQTLGISMTIEELDSGDRIRLYSKGDDNMLLFTSDDDRDKFMKFTGTACGIELEFESYSDEEAYSAANFLAVQYRLIGSPDRPQVKYKKTGDSYLTNLLCSEGGQVLDEKAGFWVRAGNRTKTMPSGLGYLARMADYASNEDVFVHDEMLRKALKDYLNLNWWEAFPCRGIDFSLADDISQMEMPINAVEALLALAPEAVFKRRLSHDDLEESELEKYFLYFSPEWFAEKVPQLPVADRSPVVERAHYTAEESNLAREWIAERETEYMRAGATIVVPEVPAKGAKNGPVGTTSRKER